LTQDTFYIEYICKFSPYNKVIHFVQYYETCLFATVDFKIKFSMMQS